jgi:uncharacterized protein
MVAAVVASGKPVGICATSHKAITNMVDALVKHCAEVGLSPRIVQKAAKDVASQSNLVDATEKNDEIESRLARGDVDVVAGTQFLFAREALEGALEVVFVDEAGQMSLANLVAMGGAARSIVLLGDPNQLAQPSQGSHPAGSEVSALEHVLNGAKTVAPTSGVFIDSTWRLRPEICSYISESFYEGRLASEDVCEAQRLVTEDGRVLAGIEWCAVEHSGNRAASSEEAQRVAQEFARLIGSQWTDRYGETRAIGIDDVLVVAPYNAHVARLASHLPDGARIGTVDRFQGQEAPIVIYSMGTSSPDDMPRTIEFLYSANRVCCRFG